jgi:cytochrome c553
MNKHYTTRRMTVTGIVLVSILQAVSAQTPASEPAGNAIAGQQLYFDHACYACHGYTGETGVRALVGSGVLVNEETFRTFLRLRAEQNPTLPSTRMPNYSEQSLGNDAVRDLYAYIRTFKRNAPELEDIPVLNAIIEAASK